MTEINNTNHNIDIYKMNDHKMDDHETDDYKMDDRKNENYENNNLKNPSPESCPEPHECPHKSFSEWLNDQAVRFTPPGHSSDMMQLIRSACIYSLIGIVYSLFFWGAWHSEVEFIKEVEETMVTTIPSFTILLKRGNYVLVFASETVGFLFYIVRNMIIFYREGSYMVMKRVPDPLEMLKRSAVLPLICSAFTAALGWAVTLLYYVLYLNLTPAAMLPAVTW